MHSVRQLEAGNIVQKLIKALRRKSQREGIAVAKVADAIGVSRMQAHRLLRQNEPPTPTIETAQRIAKYVGLELKIELVKPD